MWTLVQRRQLRTPHVCADRDPRLGCASFPHSPCWRRQSQREFVPPSVLLRSVRSPQTTSSHALPFLSCASAYPPFRLECPAGLFPPLPLPPRARTLSGNRCPACGTPAYPHSPY